MSKKTLMRLLKKETDTQKLIKLRDTGLDIILADPRVTNFTLEDKAEVVIAINERIAELEV